MTQGLSMTQFKDNIINYLMHSGSKLLGALLFFLISLWISKYILKAINRAISKSKMDKSLRSFINSLTSFGIKIVIIITTAAILGIPMATFIAILSAAGLAIGIALKDSLGNFAGGVLILTFRPFNVGDFIETEGYLGTVKDIQLLYTHLITPDNRRVVVPNGQLANGKVVNYSIERTRRVDLVFGIGYDDDFEKAKQVLNNIVTKHDKILKNPQPIIRITEHAASSINLDVKVWCNTEDYWDIYYDLNEQVKKEFDELGISIPFPQLDVHLDK